MLPSMLLDRTDEYDNITLPNSSTRQSSVLSMYLSDWPFYRLVWLWWCDFGGEWGITSCDCDAVLNFNIDPVLRNKLSTCIQCIYLFIRGNISPFLIGGDGRETAINAVWRPPLLYFASTNISFGDNCTIVSLLYIIDTCHPKLFLYVFVRLNTCMSIK